MCLLFWVLGSSGPALWSLLEQDLNRICSGLNHWQQWLGRWGVKLNAVETEVEVRTGQQRYRARWPSSDPAAWEAGLSSLPDVGSWFCDGQSDPLNNSNKHYFQCWLYESLCAGRVLLSLSRIRSEQRVDTELCLKVDVSGRCRCDCLCSDLWYLDTTGRWTQNQHITVGPLMRNTVRTHFLCSVIEVIRL